MVENRISKWEEVKEKREKGQASFRPKHSTLDYGITLTHIIQKVWGDNESIIVFLCWLQKGIWHGP